MSRRTDPVTGAQVRPVAGHRPATKEMCVCVCAQHLGRATDSPADLEILYDVKISRWILKFWISKGFYEIGEDLRQAELKLVLKFSYLEIEIFFYVI